ncbi:MAG: hypothetical protein ABIJ74_02015 [archaeon]
MPVRPGFKPKLKPFFRPVPNKVVNRLRAIVLRKIKTSGIQSIYKLMETMEIVDHRHKGFALTVMTVLEKNVIQALKEKGLKAFFTEAGPIKTKHTGGRVRRLKVSQKKYPGTEVILKRIHGADAFKTIQVIRAKVQAYNERPASKRSSQVVMPDVHLLAKNVVVMQKIEGLRGRALTNVLKENRINLPNYYFELGKVCNLLRILPDQIECVGVVKGELFFMPLMDLI